MARPRTFDEDRVLDGAVEAFRELGYDGASVPALVERLGICRQSLYATFGDKRGLYLRCLSRYGERETDGKLALLQAEGSPLENLRTVIRGWSALASQCPSHGCLTAKSIADVPDDDEARGVLEAQVARLETGYRETLDRAQAAGELRSDANTARLARSLVTICYGIGILARLPSSGPRIGDSVATMLDLVDAAAT